MTAIGDRPAGDGGVPERSSRRGGRGAPRKLGGALDRLVAEDRPQTLLAEVQAAWPLACGEAIAARSEPVSERAGKVTIACESGPWAQELELMGDLLRSRIEGLVGEGRVLSIRFTADLARHR
ncbi:MAG: DUF721 domain-containing protein [Solirubrobacterales bacterium]|nr:DUF721 domain-containing protein [Solirubrobacterales bacterium]